MEQNNGQSFVRLYSWFIFALGVSFLLAVSAALFSESWTKNGNGLIGLLEFVVSIIAIVISFGLRKFKKWALTSALVLIGIGAAVLLWAFQSVGVFDVATYDGENFLPFLAFIYLIILVLPAINLFLKRNLFI